MAVSWTHCFHLTMKLLRFAHVIPVALLMQTGGYGQSCFPPPPGLISWWRGEGNGLDSQGMNHGTVQGGGGFTNAMVRRGFLFSGGGDDYLSLPPNLFPVPA